MPGRPGIPAARRASGLGRRPSSPLSANCIPGCKDLDAPAGTVAAEIYLDAIPAQRSAGRARAALRAVAAAGRSRRDFAFIVPEGVSADALLRAIRGADKAAITGVRLFDRFEAPEGCRWRSK